MRAIAPLVLLAALFLPRAAAQNLPDLGDTSSTILSPQMERRIGEGIVRDLRFHEPAYVDDPEIEDYLTALGNLLVAAGPGANTEFEFFALRDPAINAFALPGGFIGVNTGLLVVADNESELASVLAHEVTHVTQHHIARLMGTQQQLQIPVIAAIIGALLLGRSRPDLASGAIAAAQGTAIQSSINYTRDFEREADRIGFQRLAGAGFDTHAMAAFFEKLQRYVRVMDDPAVPSYLRDHPVTTERIAEAQSRAASLPYRQHADSLEFHLVRAKLRAESGEPRDAVAQFAAIVRDRRYASEVGARYGLVSALLRAKRVPEARAEFARLRETGAQSPMIDSLAARLQLAAGDRNGALATLAAAQARFPNRRPLVLAYASVLHEAGRNDEALKLIGDQVRLHPQDGRLYASQARLYAATGKRLLQHQAQAQAYYLQGALPAAIEQLQLAQAAGDGNFYELSVIEARLKTWRAEHAEETREQRRGR